MQGLLDGRGNPLLQVKHQAPRHNSTFLYPRVQKRNTSGNLYLSCTVHLCNVNLEPLFLEINEIPLEIIPTFSYPSTSRSSLQSSWSPFNTYSMAAANMSSYTQQAAAASQLGSGSSYYNYNMAAAAGTTPSTMSQAAAAAAAQSPYAHMYMNSYAAQAAGAAGAAAVAAAASGYSNYK